MTPLRQELLGELFARATQETLGIVIETTNAQALIVNLNVYRKANPEFRDLSICTTPDVNTIFIIKKSVELEP